MVGHAQGTGVNSMGLALCGPVRLGAAFFMGLALEVTKPMQPLLYGYLPILVFLAIAGGIESRSAE